MRVFDEAMKAFDASHPTLAQKTLNPALIAACKAFLQAMDRDGWLSPRGQAQAKAWLGRPPQQAENKEG